MSNRRTPFKILYKPVPTFYLTVDNTALLISDLQRLTVCEKGGIAKLSCLKGVTSEFKEYYESVQRTVVNASKILERSRQLGLNIIFTRIVSKNKDGTDIGRQTSIWDESFPYDPDDEALSIPNEKDELILDKTCNNPFNCTELEVMLRNFGVEYIILCGVRSPGYLNTTALDAADRGFGVIIVYDAVAGGIRERKEYLTGGMVRVRQTSSVLELLENLSIGSLS